MQGSDHVRALRLRGPRAATIVDVPDAGGTWPVSINNGGDVAGYFCRNVGGYCSDYQARGFVREFNGNITAFDGIPTSINDLGTVTGYFFDTTGLHNFLRDRKGNVTVFDVPQPFPPSPAAGFAMAMNNGGDIAGYLIPCPNCDTDQGFVRDRLGGITTFVIPKGLVTTGINARGDITGHTAPFYLSEDGFVLPLFYYIGVPCSHFDVQQGFVRTGQALHPAGGRPGCTRKPAQADCHCQRNGGGKGVRAQAVYDLRFPAAAWYTGHERHVGWR